MPVKFTGSGPVTFSSTGDGPTFTSGSSRVTFTTGGDTAPQVEVGSSEPSSTTKLWLRTDDNLRAFHDFRSVDDGDVSATTDAGYPADPLTVLDVSDFYPEVFQPAKVVNGAQRPLLGTSPEQSCLTRVFADVAQEQFRVTIGLADFAEQVGTPDGTNSVNVVLTNYAGSGPIVHIYADYDVGNGTYCHIIPGWDVAGSAVLYDGTGGNPDRSVVVPLAGFGDRLGMGWDGTAFRVYFNDVLKASLYTTDADAIPRADIQFNTIPVGGTGGTWVAGYEWWALTDGDTDFDPQLLTLLEYSGGAWVPRIDPDRPGPYLPERIAALAPGGGGATNLDGLTDVTITAAASGDLLRYNGSAWVDYAESSLTLAQSQVTNLTTDLAAKVPSTRTINGYDLSANRTLTAWDVGAAATSHTHAASDVTSGTMATARLASGTANAYTHLRGDQTWASGWEVISTTTLGSDTASVSFTGLSSFAEVEVRWQGRSDVTASAESGLLLTFNSDTGANYNHGRIGRVSNATNSANASAATAAIIGFVSGSQTNTNRRSMGRVHVACDQPAAARKVVFSEWAGGQSTGDNPMAGVAVGEWTNTADAISSLQLSLVSSAKFLTGSRFVLLGRVA